MIHGYNNHSYYLYEPTDKIERWDKSMKYSIGDTVKFKLESGEIQEGNIQYIEKRRGEDILYINSFTKWAYKVPGKRIVSQVSAKK